VAGDGAERVLVHRRGGDGDAAQCHVVGAWLAHNAFHALVFRPAITDAVCRLMRVANARIFRDQFFYKPAGSGGIVPWHQDYSDWTHTTPAAHVTCWITLDDATVASGCVQYQPASHGGPLLPKITPHDTMESALQRIPAPIRAAWRPRPATVPAGGCVFHHCMTIHGSHGNTTAAPRRAIAVVYMHPETRSASSAQPVVPNGPRIAAGEIIDGPLFPLIR
jgi:ectoine hydroxylase-related dioxygenase (phytanoyl-CoA dioxygenase family)